MKDAFKCLAEHEQPCKICPLNVRNEHGETVNKAVKRSDAVNMKNYSSQHAKRKFLQMPLAGIHVETGDKESAVFLVDKNANVTLLRSLLQKVYKKKTADSPLSKSAFKVLIQSCGSDSEREKLRYAVAMTTGLSQRKLTQQFGISNSVCRRAKVEYALSRALEIRKNVDRLSHIREKAVLMSLGIDLADVDSDLCASDSQSGSETDSDAENNPQVEETLGSSKEQEIFSSEQTCKPHGNQEKSDTVLSSNANTCTMLKPQQLLVILKQKNFNWISFAETLTIEEPLITSQQLINFASQLPLMGITPNELRQFKQSYQIYLDKQGSNTSSEHNDDDIISESEDDNPEEWVGVQDLFQGPGKTLLTCKIQEVNRKRHRDAARKIAEERLLSRRRSKHVGTICRRFPDIGKEIEAFVKSCGVGAESWRRTGVLTFDGNKKVERKVTFNRIKEHLEETYGRKFSYGTVVQMCVARNRRRRSAQNYKAIAQVTTRRARKGFELRYNPDSHWSAALYCGLDVIQYTDGNDKLNLNRDDLSIFRLDSMITHNKTATQQIKGSPILTTKTDYQASYPNKLQTTSYNFTGTNNTGELCGGVVKAIPLHHKNPAQHMADFEMLGKAEHFQPAFVSPEGKVKRIECIRTDSGGDEAPCYDEVQFWWTRRHMEKPTVVQLVTSRQSGGSNLNRVELQNGCEAKARAGLFIPSTLNGSNLNDHGKIDNHRLCQNLSDAIDVYISRVQGASCGDARIYHCRGADSSDYQDLREKLLAFIRGTKAEKLALEMNHPDDYKYISTVFEVRRRHLNKNAPARYVFHLVCCYESSCPHPICRGEKPPERTLCWYEGGPPVTYIPIPAPDPNRPFGSKSCKTCKSECGGHFLPAKDMIAAYLRGHPATPQLKPPAEVIKSHFNAHGSFTDDSVVQKLAEKCVLPVTGVCTRSLWIAISIHDY